MSNEAIDEAIDLREYLDLLLRRWWLILLVTIFAVLATLAFSLRIPPASPAPNFEASSVVYLEGIEGLAWIPELAESRPVLGDVITDLDLPLGVADLGPRVSTSRVGTSGLVRITVADTDPALAASTANAVAQSYIDYILAVRGSHFVSIRKGLSDLDPNSSNRLNAPVSGDLGTSRPYIISPAETLDVAAAGGVGPAPGYNISRNLVLALLLGVVLSVALIIVGGYIQDPVRSPGQFDRKFALTRLGILPRWGNRRNQPYPLPVIDDPAPGVAEAIRQMATSMAGALGEAGVGTLAIVSPATGDGRSSAAANLGVALAGGWKTVVLLDADLRCPSLHRYFGLDNQVGLSSFLIDPDLEVDQIIQETTYPRLKIVPSGPKPANPVELLSCPRMQWLIDYLKETANVVLVDTPPLLAVTDGVVVSSQVDGAVLLVNGPDCRTETVRTAAAYLKKVGAPILGYLWKGKFSGPFGNLSQSGRYHRRAQPGAEAPPTLAGC
ncbi:MAG TPA: polysaccharide biosynthesis tyrosine autokinase [Dehalococcoidia bacterium]|nr:polysaccharide biosynthesis tyrosine autokinase [Dehalococcoidia bacterium]